MPASSPAPPPRSTILVPLDGSPAAESVLSAAVTLARRLPAEVLLLHIVERDAPDQVHGERHLTNESEANAYLAGIVARLSDEGVAARWHTHEAPVGNVARGIATHAAEADAVLILLGTHAVTDPRTWLLGAVAQQVLHVAEAPVLLQRTPARGRVTPFSPREVMVAIDAALEGEAALPAAWRLARALDVPLRLLAVVPTVQTMPGDQAIAARLVPSGAALALDAEAEAMADHLTGLASSLKSSDAGVPVTADVARGDPTRIIARAARERHAVLALASHGRSGLNALWAGSIGGGIIARGDGPFLLVHPESMGDGTWGDGVIG